jgi:predicted DNA-binding transcriptional regulator AlpA
VNSEEEVFSPIRAARYLGVTEATLRFWRANEMGPPYFKAGVKLVRYRKSDLDKWIEERVERPISRQTQVA